jgi:SAM-dependent methyltransferase
VQRYEDYHDLLFEEAVDPHCAAAKRAGREPGSVLAVGRAGARRRRWCRGRSRGSCSRASPSPTPRSRRVVARDPRVVYELANGEALPYASRSFDLVLCKEALHHLARPVLGLYEMLRVCRQRAVAIEPWSCGLIGAFDALGLTTRIERGQIGNLAARDNHVYRFGRRELAALLSSYYLESGAILRRARRLALHARPDAALRGACAVRSSARAGPRASSRAPRATSPRSRSSPVATCRPTRVRSVSSAVRGSRAPAARRCARPRAS